MQAAALQRSEVLLEGKRWRIAGIGSGTVQLEAPNSGGRLRIVPLAWALMSMREAPARKRAQGRRGIEPAATLGDGRGPCSGGSGGMPGAVRARGSGPAADVDDEQGPCLGEGGASA